VNLAFQDPKYRIKINQIQLKETKEENQETHERVHQDRQYETQAAIVRIMKSRKTMTHANLIAEVIEQTKKRGAIELGEIKQNIDSKSLPSSSFEDTLLTRAELIDKDYMEREGGTYVYVA
jgi:cullin-4